MGRVRGGPRGGGGGGVGIRVGGGWKKLWSGVRRKRGLGRVAVQCGAGEPGGGGCPVRCAGKAEEGGGPNRGGAMAICPPGPRGSGGVGPRRQWLGSGRSAVQNLRTKQKSEHFACWSGWQAANEYSLFKPKQCS